MKVEGREAETFKYHQNRGEEKGEGRLVSGCGEAVL